MNITEEYDEEVTDCFRNNSGKLRGFLINMGARADLADEIVNYSFIQLRRHWEQVRTGRPDLYLYPVARNALAHARDRDRKRTRSEQFAWSPPDGNVLDPTTGLIERLALLWALNELPRRELEAVVLRYYIGFNVAEAAQIMGDISEGAVKRYAFDGLQKLRRLLTDEPDPSGAEAR
jgi:RNA polymerase sigma factor (sigma-70 family)